MTGVCEVELVKFICTTVPLSVKFGPEETTSCDERIFTAPATTRVPPTLSPPPTPTPPATVSAPVVLDVEATVLGILVTPFSRFTVIQLETPAAANASV